MFVMCNLAELQIIGLLRSINLRVHFQWKVANDKEFNNN